ncbi:MAG: DNA repair protein RadA [Elusimicrobia bacterium HGW-Elusimicrobia-1]|jgi:DNA repair protein RadA/Sms|nr:MAG: DNA repair protein RadA [Elusimicrobia bacterium HGW-Elusimicrobia-1]
MKTKNIFRCRECGFSSAKWLGRCPECGKWNSFDEELLSQKTQPVRRTLTDFSSEVSPIDKISAGSFARTPTGIGEVDRILGGGVVDGSMVLLGGPPGIGKSTLMLEISAALAAVSGPVLYVSGEESPGQIKNRADRVSASRDGIFVLCETNLENIVEAIGRLSPRHVVIDSIQTVYRPDLAGAPGTVSQVRECAAEMLKIAKSRGISVFLLGHVTKEGDLAGPRVLEHIVDTVLYFESEKQQIYRILRVNKNRFGPAAEIGVFEMKETGLEGVSNPSALFLRERGDAAASGSVVTVSIEGSRPILVEIQSLVTKANYGVPRRQANGIDYNRMVMLIAVLERRCGFHLEFQDVYLNVAGGLKLKSTAEDLAAAVSVASASSDFTVPVSVVAVGEVGLSGEIRAVSRLGDRLKEAEAMGFHEAVVPKSGLSRATLPKKIKIHPASTLAEAVEILRERGRKS